MHTYRLVLFAALVTAQFAVHADTVYLADGTKHEGAVESEGDATLKLRVKHGPLSAVIEIPKKDIARIEAMPVQSDETELQYHVLKKEAERLAQLDRKEGAKAWLRFAQFCETKEGYSGYAKSAYEKAMFLDLTLAEARVALGYIWDEKTGWQPPHKPEITTPVAEINPIVISTRPQPSTYAPASDAQMIDYATPVSASYSNGTYSRQTYYTDGGYGYSKPVIYLASVNGRLVPYRGSVRDYFNGGYNDSIDPNRPIVRASDSGSYYGNSGYYGTTGYYSSGYYRSNAFGVSTYFSGGSGSFRYQGSINGGFNRCGTGSYFSTGGSGFRLGFRW